MPDHSGHDHNVMSRNITIKGSATTKKPAQKLQRDIHCDLMIVGDANKKDKVTLRGPCDAHTRARSRTSQGSLQARSSRIIGAGEKAAF